LCDIIASQLDSEESSSCILESRFSAYISFLFLLSFQKKSTDNVTMNGFAISSTIMAFILSFFHLVLLFLQRSLLFCLVSTTYYFLAGPIVNFRLAAATLVVMVGLSGNSFVSY